MKLNRIILPIMACTLALGSCDDQIMEWKESDSSVTAADIPLALREKLANYDFIKAYAQQYTPNMTIGLGLGADLYISDTQYKQVADENFQMFTTGNAMKHSSVVKNNGDLDFTTIDAFLNAVPSDIQVYGHNFLWHTQQRQTYLKSLIAPDVIIEIDPTDKVENIITNSDFEAGNISGWGAWSAAGCIANISEAGAGYESDYAMKLHNPVAGSNYSAQAYYTLPEIQWEAGETYIVSFYVYSENANSDFQIQLQSRMTYTGGSYQSKEVPAGQWYYFESEFEMTQKTIDLNPTHLTIDFGFVEGTSYIDNIKFGKKKEGVTNYCQNGSFENETTGWTLTNPGTGIETIELSDAPDGQKVLKMTASSTSSQPYDLQITSSDMPTMPGKKVQLSFYVKSDQEGRGRVTFDAGMKNRWPWMNWTGNQPGWTETFGTTTDWQLISVVLQNFDNDFTEGATTWNFNMEFGYMPDVTYYIDNIQIIEYIEDAQNVSARAATRAGGISYKLKTPEEKKTALLGAMESWIKGMLEHTGDRIKQWDVINEPIADNNQWRGIEGNFMSNGDDAPDTAPVESEESGLNLNWADDHFYWGYYIGKEYAVKAFEYARRYAPSDAKLYVNDYNLETNPSKLSALIDFVKYIEDNGQTVDGIGTQMHVSSSITREQIDAMFKTMAATGKLVRVTELDVQVGTTTPDAGQLETQAKVYQMIFESYKENVPEAQQSGITIWTLTDSTKEHEYWLSGDAPNLFDANYGRKHAYKGVCDGIAGKDISEDFTGNDWDKTYEEATPAE